MQAGAKVEFEVHYHAVGYEVTDVMESAWWLYPKDSPPKYNAQFVAVGITAGQLLEIPPNSVTETKGTYVMPAPGIFHNFQPHMHFRGKAFLMEAIYPTGRREVINYTSQFDNTWHLNYVYDPDYAPLLPKGHRGGDHRLARQHGGQPQQPGPAAVGGLRAAHGVTTWPTPTSR